MPKKKFEQVSVLIVGGGPVGLSLAIELGLRGIDCILIEQRGGHPQVPRMSQVSGRNMEFCRRWGIAKKVRGAVWSSTHPLDFVYATSLTGEELARVKIPSYQKRGKPDYSPEGTCACPQIYFDPILAEKASSLRKVKIRYKNQLKSFEQDNEKISAHIIDLNSGSNIVINAKFIVGCDGSGGAVRTGLNIPLDGLGTIATSVNVFFRSSELATLHDKGWARFYRLIDKQKCWAELIAIDGKELWRLTVFNDPKPDKTGRSYLKKMAGQNFSYEVIDVSPWERRDYLAQRFQNNRAFIAGDAAQQCSPTGGLGMHTGVCEAVNLAWKIEATLQGWGGPKLLDSYEEECQPIANKSVELSTNSFNAINALPGDEGFRTAIKVGKDITQGLAVPDELRTQLYFDNSPICIPDGDQTKQEDIAIRNSSIQLARPGARAPHVWVNDGKSTLDLFGSHFTFLCIGKPEKNGKPMELAATRYKVPFKVLAINNRNMSALYKKNFVLVRPDGHISWQGNYPPKAPEKVIKQVVGA